MQQSSSQIRYKLSLTEVPDEKAAEKVCRLIYGRIDKTLVGAMLSTPYTIGRSFDEASMREIAEEIKNYHVSFSCKSLPPHNLEFSHDASIEESAPQLEALDSRKRSFKLPKRSLLAGAVSFSIVALGIAFFFLQDGPSDEASSIANPPNTKPDLTYEAQLNRLFRKVEFRRSNDLLWSKANAGIGLNENDAVRTFENSRAVLEYRRGPRISVRENSLVIVGKVVLNREVYAKGELELEEGGLQARMPAGENGQRLEIKTPQGRLQIEGPKSKKAAETQVTTRIQDGGLEVRVERGEAVFIHANRDEPKLRLESFQEMKATNQKSFPPTEIVPSLQLIAPEPRAQIQNPEQLGSTQSFEWQPIDGAETYTWRLYSDSSMQTILLERQLNSTELELAYLDSGDLYWQVETEVDGVSLMSELRSINVQ